MEPGERQVRVDLAKGLLHRGCKTLYRARGADDPARLEPDVRDVDEPLFHLCGRNIDYWFSRHRRVATHAGTLGDVTDHADDGIRVLLDLNVAANGIQLIEELASKIDIDHGNGLRRWRVAFGDGTAGKNRYSQNPKIFRACIANAGAPLLSREFAVHNLD